MEKVNSENLNIGEARGGKSNTNLSALADSMQFLSLGVPGVSRPKKFNVNAWSTPLKSIENQPRRVAREKNYQVESADDANDDSLSNLSDLFPGQNCFEKTSDFVEYYRLNSSEESNCAPVGDESGFRPTCSPNESPAAGLGISNSNSNSPPNRSQSAKKFANSSELSISRSAVVERRFSPPHSAEKLESPITRRSEPVLTDSTVSLSPFESLPVDRLTLVAPEVDRSSRSSHPSNDVSARFVGRPSSPAADERRVEYGSDVGCGDDPPLSPEHEGSSMRERSDWPIDDEIDVSGCNSTTSDENFYLAISRIENASCDSPSSKCGRLDNDEEASPRHAVNGVEAVPKRGDEAILATRTDGGSPYVTRKEDSVSEELDDEYEIVAGSPLSQSSAVKSSSKAANRSSSTCALVDRVDCSYSPTTPPVSGAPSAVGDSPVRAQLHSGVPSPRAVDVNAETGDRTEVSTGAEPSSLARPALSRRSSNGWTTGSGVEVDGDEQTACGAFSTAPLVERSNSRCLDVSDCVPSGACLTSSPSFSSNFEERNRVVRECARVTPSPDVGSPLDVICADSSKDVAECDEADDVEDEFVAASFTITPLLSETVCDVVGRVRRVSPDQAVSRDSSPKKSADLSPRATTTPPRLLAAASSTEPHRCEDDPTAGYCDHVVLHSENSVHRLWNATAELEPSIDVSPAPHTPLDAAESPSESTNGVDHCEDNDERRHSSFTSQHLTAEKISKLPRLNCSDEDRSFVADIPHLASSQTDENDRFAEYEVENECDSAVAVSTEKIISFSTLSEKAPSKIDGHPSERSATPPFDCKEQASTDVDEFHSAVVVVAATDKPTSHQHPEESPIDRHANGEHDVPADKLTRVRDSMSKLMLLCTPRKGLRTQSRTPINPFRCPNVGNESQKIVFDFPTSLLDVSIGMLESMTAMMAPVQSTRGVSYPDEINIASDLISVAQTPGGVPTRPNRTNSSSHPNASIINKRLLEDNENLKTELEEYKRKYDVLRGEYESILETAFALRTNETTLKKALREYEDETRKACNKYLILKEYVDTLIMSSNRSLDYYEEELKMKNDELQKLKGTL